MYTLIWLPYSPWSIKARWALKQRAVPHQAMLYVPMLGEPLLRLRTGRLFSKATVPTLLGEGITLTDSYDIAQLAEREGKAGTPSLFPQGLESEVARVNALADRLCAGGRLRTTRRVKRDDAAVLESVPLPRIAGTSGALLSIGRVGVRFIERAYSEEGMDDAECLRLMTETLEEIEDQRAGKDTLLAEPSYADYAVAVALQFVEPVERYVPLGHANRRCWYEPELAGRFSDLLAFRDRVFATRHWRAGETTEKEGGE